jgi:hypothetical protein
MSDSEQGYVSKGGSVWDGKHFSDRKWYWEGKKGQESYNCVYHNPAIAGVLRGLIAEHNRA